MTTFFQIAKFCILVITFQSLFLVNFICCISIREATVATTNFTECTPETGNFLCKSKTECIPSIFTCDNKNDCTDGSDEIKNCDKSCSNLQCSHSCTPNVDSDKPGVCYCNKGFKISGKKKNDCINLNECKIWDTCSHGCEDTIGSFNCICLDGFILGKDNRTCTPIDSNVQLVYALKNSIRVWSKKDNKVRIIAEGRQTVGVAVDVANKYVFWTEVENDRETIYRAKLNGENRTALINTGLYLPEGIAFDWVTGNIYFADANKSHIVACNGEGTFCSVLIQGLLDQPRGFALHPSHGLMFWTDWGKTPSIVRAGMDGSIPLQIVIQELVWPNGLAVDQGKSRLYWMDADKDTIETSTLTGEDRRIIKSEGIDHPFSLDVFADTLYWSDWQLSNIQGCNKLTGKNHTVLVKDVGGGYPHGLAIFHPAAQPKSILNPCNSARCSHICVLTPQNSSACVCPTGMLLDKNNKTCIDDKTKAKFVIGHDDRLRTLRSDSIGRNVLEETTVSGLKNIGAIVYNPINDTLMISDTRKRKIYEYNPKLKKLRVVMSNRIETVRGLSFDIIGQNLYWVDSSLRRVEVMSMRTGARATISHETQNYPQDILVIPERKYLFVVVTSIRGGRILRMLMNGFKRSTIYRISGGEPISLTYNIELDRIFWCDVIKNTVEHVTLDGRSQSTALRSEGSPFSIVSLENKVFWTDRHTQILSSMTVYGKYEKQRPIYIGHPEDRENSTLDSYIMGNFLAKVAIINKDISRYETLIYEHDCSNDGNPKCSHICLISESDNLGTCICPEGMQITRDEKTCSFNTTCLENEFQCNDKKCIRGEEKCDGFSDCSEGEDEVNCPLAPTLPCTSSDFFCKSDNTCINSKLRCDRKYDCDDGSDEVECDCTFDSCVVSEGEVINEDVLNEFEIENEDDDRSEDDVPNKIDSTIKDEERNKGVIVKKGEAPIFKDVRRKNKLDKTNEIRKINTDSPLTVDERMEEISMNSKEDESSGTATAVIITIILVLLALAIILGFILQKKRIYPKTLVRPYMQQLVKYVNRPVKRWRRSENGREKLPDENTYDDACDCSTGIYGKGTYANPTYEEIDGNTTIKMMNQNSGNGNKDDGGRSSSDSGILTVMDTDPNHLYESLDNHYNSYSQRDTLLDKEFV